MASPQQLKHRHKVLYVWSQGCDTDAYSLYKFQLLACFRVRAWDRTWS